MPKADAGPLNGALWPMVISVSVTPGPYFLSCAWAAVDNTNPPATNAIVVARIVSSRSSTASRRAAMPGVKNSPSGLKTKILPFVRKCHGRNSCPRDLPLPAAARQRRPHVVDSEEDAAESEAAAGAAHA